MKKTFKIATWNVNSLRVRLPHVLQWLASEQPDVLAIQETKLVDENFPTAEILQAGYQVSFSGQPTYNGVAILSRETMTDVETSFFDTDPQRRSLAVTTQGIRIFNLYVPNGESVGSDKYQYKLNWLRSISAILAEQLKVHQRMIILGDFNIAPEDRDVYDPVEWAGKVLCSDPERAMFQEILQHGFKDCFRLHEQPEKSFSWWDYRLNAFKRKMGLRIDHILASEALAKQCERTIIDKDPRGWERPSDHTPVVAEFVVSG